MNLEVLDFIPVATPVLKALVAQYQSTLEPVTFATFLAQLREAFRGYQAALALQPAGPERARAAHQLLEATMVQLPAEPTCRRGCSACCHLEVEITRDEGELLAESVRGGRAIDRARLALQAERPRQSASWSLLVVPENRCVFLEGDGACGVYADRPGACRKHVVVSPASECARLGGQPVPITIPLAELVVSAALSLPNNPFQSLSKAVLEGLAPRATSGAGSAPAR